jgi:ATP synthase protein I
MMTTAGPVVNPTVSVFPGLRVGLFTVTATSLIALLAAFVAEGGGAAAAGVLVGFALVGGFFAFGGLVVSAVSAISPAASMLVALVTYALQIAVVALVFAKLSSSGSMDDSIDSRWLAGTVIVGTLAWTVAQVVGSMRERRPLYDLPAAGSTAVDGEVGRS